ncbi:abnormal spindle-like microcephaly-associated -like protein, partial [Brachionus plicatilis]
MTDCVANSHGLVFSISPAKKQPKSKKDDEDEENILTLAPFTKPPKINFGQLKINESVQRSVLIINPQQFDLDLIVTNNELNINNIQLKIEKLKNVNLKITWCPEKPGNHKFAILFEVTNSARLKFLVHAFGVCIKPEEKKPIRKPFNMLQPLKKKTEKAPVQKKETTVSTKYKTTTTTTTTIYKKSAGQKSKFDETVIIEKSGNKENSNHLGIT